MFDFKKKSHNSVPRPSLYCVWIPAFPDKETPLIRVWIDPSMSMFESQATLHEPDLEAARAEAFAAPSKDEDCPDGCVSHWQHEA